MIRFLAARGEQIVVLTDGVLAVFAAHRQLRLRDSEAGGQLFARFDGREIRVEQATGPRRGDGRSRFSFIPSRWAERREIKRMHKQGLHYVGDWHTHPERRPTPSCTDRDSMQEMFRASKHDLAGFLMVIVGTDDGPAGLYVGVVDGERAEHLVPLLTLEIGTKSARNGVLGIGEDG